MAVVSNKCNGSLGDYCKVYLDYTINNKEEDRIARNKSNITLKLYGQATSSSVGAFNLYGTAKAYLKIDGTTKKSSTTLNMDFRNKAKVEMLTWTGDVAHNDDGSLTITISGNELPIEHRDGKFYIKFGDEELDFNNIQELKISVAELAEYFN